MITGFFDDGYGLGIPTKITLSPGRKKTKIIKEDKNTNEENIRIDKNYVFMTSKGITPFDIIARKSK